MKLSRGSKDALAGGIADLLDGCIVNFGTQVTKLRKVSVKASINKQLTKLKVIVKVDFQGKGNGLFHDLKGDDKDLYILRVSGPLTIRR